MKAKKLIVVPSTVTLSQKKRDHGGNGTHRGGDWELTSPPARERNISAVISAQ